MQGGVYKIKPLGVYAMIDDGELDWKVGQRAYLHDHLFVRTHACTNPHGYGTVRLDMWCLINTTDCYRGGQHPPQMHN